MQSGRLILVLGDGPVAGKLSVLAREMGLTVRTEEDGQLSPSDLAAVVVDLARPSALDELGSWRQRAPEALLVAHLATPRRELWEAAERAGCDLVTNRGALVARLRGLLSAGPTGGRRLFPLMDVADVAGRLGLVRRVQETPVGPVALYQVDGRLSCVGDICPHAGATVSEGELDGAVVTCPGHGSRFDVSTGERVRGPADCELQRFEVVVSEGRVQLVWT